MGWAVSIKRRLNRLEANTPKLEPDTPSPLTPRGVKVAGQVMTRRFKAGVPLPPPPEAIELLAEEVIRQLKAGTAKPELLSIVPELLRSEHVPQELKRELKALWVICRDV